MAYAQNQVFVDPAGADSNIGTAQAPVATLDAARDRARAIHCHNIVVRKGRYLGPVQFDARDSGLRVMAAAGAHPLIDGAVEIPMTAVRQCRDEATLGRIVDSSARSRVKEVDLAKLGLTDLPAIQARGFPHSGIQAPNELFEGERPMTLARWPNAGFAKVGTVKEPGNGENDHDKPMRRPVFSVGERAKLWVHAEDPWLYGYWKFDWADESIRVHHIDPDNGEITLETPATYGVDTGTPFFAENLLEELDAPGEYYIDRHTARLYFIPAMEPSPKEPLRISVVDKPLIAVENASRVTLAGLSFGYSRGDGISIHGGDHIRCVSCNFLNLGQRAANVEGGHDSGLYGCRIWQTAEGGVRLAGGDRNTLQGAHNFVRNSEIYDFERRSQTYRPAVWIEGVGNVVSHCFIHDAPHSAIIYGGNDHIIENNRFSRLLKLTGDGGVVYTGRNWTARGTIIRDNWFEDDFGQRKWEPAIYVDDLGSGILMTGNLIERCHWGFLIGGGRDNLLANNVLVDCDLAFDCDARGLGWAARSRPTMMEGLNAVPYQSDVWRARYPNLPNILSEDPMAPAGNILRDNILIRSGTVTKQMEAPFKKTATITGNREVNALSDADAARIRRMRANAGVMR